MVDLDLEYHVARFVAFHTRAFGEAQIGRAHV